MNIEAELHKNRKLIHGIAFSRYPFLCLDDKVQAVTIGAIRALRTFDPKRGPWLSYLARLGYHELNDMAREVSYPVVIPHNMDVGIRTELRRCHRLNCEFDPRNVAKVARTKLGPVMQAMNVIRPNGKPLALIADDAVCRDDRPTVVYSHVEQRVDVLAAIDSALTAGQRKYVKAYFFGPAGTTMHTVAADFGVSPQCVHRMIHNAIPRLKIALRGVL